MKNFALSANGKNQLILNIATMEMHCPPQIVQEDFLPCIGEKCMAYSRTGKCLLMKKEEFPYNAITDEFINILERGKNNVS